MSGRISNKDTSLNVSKNDNSQKKEDNPHYDIKLDTDKSEIFKLMKNNLAKTNFQLSTALDNVYLIEEKENKMQLKYFVRKEEPVKWKVSNM